MNENLKNLQGCAIEGLKKNKSYSAGSCYLSSGGLQGNRWWWIQSPEREKPFPVSKTWEDLQCQCFLQKGSTVCFFVIKCCKTSKSRRRCKFTAFKTEVLLTKNMESLNHIQISADFRSPAPK